MADMKTSTYDHLTSAYGGTIAAQVLHCIIQACEAKRLRHILTSPREFDTFDQQTLARSVADLVSRLSTNRVKLKYALHKHNLLQKSS